MEVYENKNSTFWLTAALGLLLGSGALLGYSFQFVHGEDYASRPIVPVTLVLGLMGALYFVVALRAFVSPPPLRIVIPVAILARVVLLPSTPIQEDDIYRYIWDGKVTAAGLDPYRFSPTDIERFEVEGSAPSRGDVPALLRLVALKRSESSVGEVFARINNRDFATIYPALSQVIFRLHGVVTPASWSPAAQVISLKSILTVFDLATLVALLFLLRLSGKPYGLCVLYAWCPLILKEITNSGHMDAIPTFLLVVALGAGARGLGSSCGLAFGAAIASKFYAVLVLPVVLRALGLRRTLLAALGVCALAGPFLLAYPEGGVRRGQTLQAFAMTWANNDAIFSWIESAGATLCDTDDASRVLALGAVFAFLAALAAVVAWRTTPGSPPAVIFHRSFLVLAFAFLLGPLGFPWYFTWCVPLLPFATQRAWLLLPGLLPIYYLRFWFDYQFPHGLAGFEDATEFFDRVVVPIEFGIFYVALAGELWCRRLAGKCLTRSPS
jgi:hypothetical protein